MKLIVLFVATVAAATIFIVAVTAANPQYKSDFGLDGADFDFWHWDYGFRNWNKNCEKYNISTTNDIVQTRITGGNLAETNMFPYQAGLLLLRAPKIYQCGGALISQHYVLTAAHCLYGSTLGKVYLGSNDFANEDTSAAIYNVTYRDFYIYEKYVYHGGLDDIALIYLQKPVPLSARIQTIPLARVFMTQALLENQIVTTSGWGRTSDDPDFTAPNLLLYFIDVPVLPQQECACYYIPGLVRRRNHICTDGAAGRGSCDGDSGGPLTFYYKNVNYLVGLTAFGSAGGCEIGYPSVYTRITSYLGWIAWRTGGKVY